MWSKGVFVMFVFGRERGVDGNIYRILSYAFYLIHRIYVYIYSIAFRIGFSNRSFQVVGNKEILSFTVSTHIYIKTIFFVYKTG